MAPIEAKEYNNFTVISSRLADPLPLPILIVLLYSCSRFTTWVSAGRRNELFLFKVSLTEFELTCLGELSQFTLATFPQMTCLQMTFLLCPFCLTYHWVKDDSHETQQSAFSSVDCVNAEIGNFLYVLNNTTIHCGKHRLLYLV